VEELFPIVLQAYQDVARDHDVVLIEGAGSPAEINLKARDIVNMRMAQGANAACLLVGDIDRGGVFASLLGTVELLEPCERALLRGFVVNKFRGDAGLLKPGIEMIAGRIQLPCAGVVPHLPDLGLDEEDSVALEERRTARDAWSVNDDGPGRRVRIGVVAFPYLANFTDFDALAAEPSVSLAFLDHPDELDRADLLILPGSKQTLDDLAWLRRRGLEPGIQNFRGRAGVVGICGGMQMLGRSIEDAAGVENSVAGRAGRGLGMLPIATVLTGVKVTRTARGRVSCGMLFGQPLTAPCFQGYEIHLGDTVYAEGAVPFAEIQRDGETSPRADGAADASRRAFGTYIHGLFNDDRFRHSFLDAARAACGLSRLEARVFVAAEREARIDRLADHVRRALDMDLIRSCLGAR
jgi:adenosylcobyric acid synthase